MIRLNTDQDITQTFNITEISGDGATVTVVIDQTTSNLNIGDNCDVAGTTNYDETDRIILSQPSSDTYTYADSKTGATSTGTIKRDGQDITSEVPIYIGGDNQLGFQNTTDRTLTLRMNIKTQTKNANDFQDNGQAVKIRFYKGANPNSFTSAILMTLNTITWVQADSIEPVFTPEIRDIALDPDEVLFVTFESDDVADLSLRLYPTRIWEDVDNIGVSADGDPQVDAVSVGGNTPLTADDIATAVQNKGNNVQYDKNVQYGG